MRSSSFGDFEPDLLFHTVEDEDDDDFLPGFDSDDDVAVENNAAGYKKSKKRLEN